MFELQSKWIAGALSNRIALPSPEDMVEDVKAFYASLEASEKPIQYTHNVGSYQVIFSFIQHLIRVVLKIPCARFIKRVTTL